MPGNSQRSAPLRTLNSVLRHKLTGAGPILCGMMEPVLTWPTRASCLALSSACTAKRNFPASALAWPPCNASSIAMTDEYGRRAWWTKAPRSISQLVKHRPPGVTYGDSLIQMVFRVLIRPISIVMDVGGGADAAPLNDASP